MKSKLPVLSWQGPCCRYAPPLHDAGGRAVDGRDTVRCIVEEDVEVGPSPWIRSGVIHCRCPLRQAPRRPPAVLALGLVEVEEVASVPKHQA